MRKKRAYCGSKRRMTDAGVKRDVYFSIRARSQTFDYFVNRQVFVVYRTYVINYYAY